MKNKKRIYMILCVAFCAGLLLFVPAQNYQREISDKILRFHVVANSNTMEDQELKLFVRDKISEFLQEPLSLCRTKSDSEAAVKALLPQIQEVARACVQSRGYDYPVSAGIGERYFPEKTYGDMTFPRGYYEALTINIGSGSGRNWWCVLFPNLCFTDAVTAAVPEESRDLLKDELCEETYESLFEGDKVQLRFKLAEIFQ